MISFLYFLLASCFLIGCFANFAGNDYGFSLVTLSTFGFVLFLVFRGISMARKIMKNSIAGAALLLAEYWLPAVGLSGIIMKFERMKGAAVVMILGFLLVSIFFILRSMGSIYAIRHKNNRFSRARSALMLLFCSSALFTTLAKFMNWPALLSLIISVSLLVLLLLLSLFRFIFEKKQVLENTSPLHLLSPVHIYFYILLLGTLHFSGTILGWFPGFQFPERPLAFSRLLEQPESAALDYRMHCFIQNIDNFFAKRQFSGVAEPDSTKFCLPENGK